MLEPSQQGKRNYAEAMRKVIPSHFLLTAARLVESYRTKGLPKNMEPMMMANVLIVEDNPQIADIYSRMAKEADHTVNISTSAHQAVEDIEKENYNLILTDGMGLGWLQVVKAAQKKGVRAIVITSNEQTVKFATKNGYEAFDKMKSETRTSLKDIFSKL